MVPETAVGGQSLPRKYRSATTKLTLQNSSLLYRSNQESEKPNNQVKLAELGQLELIKAAAQGLTDGQADGKIAAEGAAQHMPVQL